jgi:hypothetical protein
VAISGGYAYVADGIDGLRIINITSPASPTEVGFFDTPGYAWGVAVAGAYAYLVDGEGLHIINIANPARPSPVGTFDILQDAKDIVVVDNYAYVADFEQSAYVINIANPANPTEAGLYRTTPGYPEGVAVAGDYVYVAEGFAGMQVLRFIRPEPISPTLYLPIIWH